MKESIHTTTKLLGICVTSLLLTPAYTHAATQVNGVTYNTLEEAISKANSGDTIQLTSDCVSTSNHSFKAGTYTIDLNGYDIVNTYSGSTILVDTGVTLTIKDSSSKGSISNSVGTAVLAQNGGSVVVDGGTILGNTSALSAKGGSSVTINGGTFDVQSGSASSAISITNGSNCTVNGSPNVTGNYAALIASVNTNESNPYPATIKINGGTFTGKNSGITVKGGSALTITSGTFMGVNSTGFGLESSDSTVRLLGGNYYGGGNAIKLSGNGYTSVSDAVVNGYTLSNSNETKSGSTVALTSKSVSISGESNLSISSVSAKRTSDAAGSVNFTSSKAGVYFYLVKDASESAPSRDDVLSDGVCGTMIKGSNSISLTDLSSATPKKIYIVGLGDDGSIGSVVSTQMNAYNTATGLTSGSVARISTSSAYITFTSSSTGVFYYLVQDSSLPAPSVDKVKANGTVQNMSYSNTINLSDLTSNENKTLYIVGVANGTTFPMLTVAVPERTTTVTLSDGKATKTSNTTATTTFKATVAGTYYYKVQEATQNVPTAAEIMKSGKVGTMSKAVNTLSLTGLSGGAKKVYIVGYNPMNGDLSAVYSIALDDYDVNSVAKIGQSVTTSISSTVRTASISNPNGTFSDASNQLIRSAIVKDAKGDVYIVDENGNKYISCMVRLANGTRYYTSSSGSIVQSTTFKFKNNIYYAKSNGKIASAEFVTLNNKTYYASATDGHFLKSRVFTVDGKKYYASSTGALVSDKLITYNGKKYYANSDCTLAKSKFVTVDGTKYYFSNTCAAVKSDFILYKNKTYFIDSNYSIVKNKVITISGQKYYATSTGEIANSKIVTIKGNDYYADSEGKLVKNKLVTVSGSKYIVGTDYKVIKNKLITYNGRKYYAGSDGRLVISKWVTVGNCKYYCGKTGAITSSVKK